MRYSAQIKIFKRGSALSDDVWFNGTYEEFLFFLCQLKKRCCVALTFTNFFNTAYEVENEEHEHFIKKNLLKTALILNTAIEKILDDTFNLEWLQEKDSLLFNGEENIFGEFDYQIMDFAELHRDLDSYIVAEIKDEKFPIFYGNIYKAREIISSKIHSFDDLEFNKYAEYILSENWGITESFILKKVAVKEFLKIYAKTIDYEY